MFDETAKRETPVATKDSKSAALKQTIQKIVRANNDFVRKQSLQLARRTDEGGLKPPISVAPAEIVFESVSPGLDYSTTFTVTNLTNKQKKVKIRSPKSTLFSFGNLETVVVAPGLQFTCRIGFKARTTDKVQDSFAVISDDYSVVVPISVFGPRGFLAFESSVNLGFVQPETPIGFKVKFSNTGQEPLTFDFTPPEEFSLISNSFPLTIGPNSTELVGFEALFPRAGPFKCSVALNVSGQTARQYLDLSATAVSFSNFVVNEKGNEVSVLNFENLSVGEERHKRLTIVNNSPKPSSFRVQILKGINNEHFQEAGKPQTPFDLGLELSEQVIFVEPSSGTIDSYGYQVLNFRLKTTPTPEERFIVSKFAISAESCHPETLSTRAKRSFNYTACISFEDSCPQKLVQMFANAFCPLVNLSAQSLHFGDLQVGQTQRFDLSLTNHNVTLPVRVHCPKESFLHCDATDFALAPQETRLVRVEFCPKNLGNFSGNYFFRLNNCFDVKLEVLGSASSPADRRKSVPHARPVPAALLGSVQCAQTQPTPTTERSKRPSGESKPILTCNKSVQPQTTTPRASFLPPIETKHSMAMRKSVQGNFSAAELPEPVPTLAKDNPALFVLKPIKNNEPVNLKTVSKKFTPDPKLFFSEFPSSPKDYEEARHITEKLSGAKLMRLQVGPTELNFGKIFANSTSTLFFQVKNDLWTSVSCVLNTDKIPELRETPQRPQVIPSGKISSFRVAFCSATPKCFREKVYYTLNGGFTFYFMVAAEVVPVDLEVSRPIINFRFKEESTDMTTSEVLTLRNLGNAPAAFRLRCDNPHSPFRLAVCEGVVRENSTKDVEIAYSPAGTKDEEVFLLEIEKGALPKAIRCIGNVNETSCDVAQGSINLGSLAVSQKKSASAVIRNTHNKFYAVFRLDESSLPEGVDVRPRQGRVCPEDTLKLEFDFLLRKRSEYRNHEILFNVRGGPPLRVLFSAATVLPTVEIEQQDFNFGKVTFGNKAHLPLTISNKSLIPAELFLNLTANSPSAQEKFDCIEIESLAATNSDSLVFERTDLDPSSGLGPDKAMAGGLRNLSSRDGANKNPGSLHRLSEPKASCIPSRPYLKTAEEPEGRDRNIIFFLKPNRTYNFNLLFAPLKPSVYDFDLVFSIPGQELSSSMTRRLHCVGTNPQFLMEPLSGVIEFPRKIILSQESVAADTKMLTISNPSFDEPLTWALGLPQDPLSTFTLAPSNGVIDPQCTVTVRIGFRPLKAQAYEAVVPLFINNKPTPNTEIKLKGESSLPKVLFSAEELLLPATPLNVVSSGYLALLNDGYQNSSFTLSVPPEYVKLGLVVDFFNNNHLGINNNKIFVKVSFASSTPVSFTAKVTVHDDLKGSFPFCISGASDNSVLTYASFLSVGFAGNSLFRRNLEFLEATLNLDPEFRNCQSIAIDPVTRAPKITFRSDKKPPGYPGDSHSAREEGLVAKDSNGLEESDQVATEYHSAVAQTLRSWLLGYGVSTVHSFPEDLVQQNGAPFYELLEFLIKSPPPRPVLDPNLKNAERVAALVQQHFGLLNFLKENNAMVNVVRPHFLLGHKDMLAYFKANAAPHVDPDFYKVSEAQFRLLSLQSWTTLFMQAIKVFFVARISLRDFKTALGLLSDQKRRELLPEESPPDPKPPSKSHDKTRDRPQDKPYVVKDLLSPAKSKAPVHDPADHESAQAMSKLLPDYPYDKNLLYSPAEALLLRWLEVLHEMHAKEPVRIPGFGRELQNFYFFSVAIDLYTSGESRLLGRVNPAAFLQEEIAANYELFKTALFDFGIKEEFNEGDFSPANPAGLLLLAVHLFKTLPPYVPRSTIEFNCALHERMVKEVVLHNPTPKPIIYSVRIFGPKNFSVDLDLAKMDPRGNCAIAVSFSANTSFPVDGKVFFQNRRNGKSFAGAVVFNLRANVVSRFSMRTFTISNVNLYEVGNSEITVTNPFDKDVDFKIRIENVPVPSEAAAKPVKPAKPGKLVKKEPASVPEPEPAPPAQFLPSFFIKQDRLWIRKGSSAKLFVQYLPMTFEPHKCHLVFLDPKVGEVQYEVQGTPRQPSSLDTFRVTVPVETFSSVELTIPFKNAFFSAGLLKLADKLKEAKEFAVLPLVEKMAGSFENAFDVEVTPSEFLTCHSPFIFVSKKELAASKQAGREQQLQAPSVVFRMPTQPSAPQTAKLVFEPTKKVPFKDLHLTVCLKGRQKFDHRFYDLYLTVLPKTVKATIEIKTTARIPVTQNIPITNSADFDCTIRPSFTPVLNGQFFEVPLSPFQVKRKSLINFPLKFLSPWVERAEGRLTLFNLTTNDNFEYLLKVECGEPLSESHEEVSTKAKKRTEIVLKVKNSMPECRAFRVDCDIPDAEFPRRLVFEDSKTTDLRIGFTPIIGGSFMYSATFSDDNGRYFWHLMTVHVDSPEPMRSLFVSTEIRKPTALRIELDNPYDREVRYKVMLIGDFLTGDKTFRLPPVSHDCYQLYYFPLKIENSRKKVGFLSDEEGEVWFDVDCRCEEAKQVKLPTFRAELGKSVTQHLTFRNPLKKRSVFVATEQAESSNFTVAPKKFEIKPGESASVAVTFTPRELNNNATELLSFVSSEIGEWKYQLFGVGVPPTDFDPTTISTALGKPVTKTFSFRNPFSQEVTFHVFIDSQGARDVFEMLVPKQKSMTLGPLSALQVMVKFSPAEIFTYRTRLVVKINEALQWVFPIVGITEAVQGFSEFHVRTKCGVEFETQNAYRLVGITNITPDEVFEHSFKIQHKEAENIEKWLKVKPLRNRLSSADEELLFAFNFLPHKPFKTVVEFVLSKPSGGRWKFKINVTATDPDFFDTLSIVSQLNVRKTIQFRLFNADKKVSSPFTAYYTQDSDSEFMVGPAKGVLEPAINDGTIIEVSYLPTQYGKAKTGVLLVETDQNLWRFLIRGMFEKYVPPSSKH